MRRFGSDISGIDNPRKKENNVGKVSTISGDGKTVAVTNMNNSQLRNLKPVSQYGVASSPTPGLQAFVISIDTSDSDGIVGVYDPNRPACKAGETILYSSGGATVKLSGGSVLINGINILGEISAIKERLNTIEADILDIKSKL